MDLSQALIEYATSAASIVFSAVSYVVYVWGIFRYGVKPQRTTWFIYWLIAAVVFGTQLSLGSEGSALWLSLFQVLSLAVVCLLSIRFGTGGRSRTDMACLCIAIVAVLLWKAGGNAELGLIAAVAAGLAGSVPSLLKAAREPSGDAVMTWALGTAAAFCALLGVTSLTWTALIFPCYLIAVNGTMTLLLTRGRLVQAIDTASSEAA